MKRLLDPRFSPPVPPAVNFTNRSADRIPNVSQLLELHPTNVLRYAHALGMPKTARHPALHRPDYDFTEAHVLAIKQRRRERQCPAVQCSRRYSGTRLRRCNSCEWAVTPGSF